MARQPYSYLMPAIAPHVDPRHLEAWMRSEHGCLDGLSKERLAEAIVVAAECVEQAPDLSEQLAQSFGL